jgi:hypothetical protein
MAPSGLNARHGCSRECGTGQRRVRRASSTHVRVLAGGTVVLPYVYTFVHLSCMTKQTEKWLSLLRALPLPQHTAPHPPPPHPTHTRNQWFR